MRRTKNMKHTAFQNLATIRLPLWDRMGLGIPYGMIQWLKFKVAINGDVVLYMGTAL